MNSISVFYEHILEAASQDGITVEEALRFAHSCGITLLECDHWRLSSAEETKALFDSCEMGVSCIYEHFDFLHDSEDTSREKYTKLFETARFFGCDKVLCIPGFFGEGDHAPQLEIFSQRLAQMCAAAMEYGITVTVENFDDINSPCCKIDDLLYLLKNTEGLRFTFDTGNFRYCLEDAADSYTKLKGYVSHVHCKDRSYDKANSDKDGTNGKADLSGEIMYPAEVCSGVIRMGALLRQLMSDGYNGVLAIEHFGAKDQRGYMKASAENIHRFTNDAAIRVTVWNEYIHEVKQEWVAEIYPKGIHGCIADFLSKDNNINVVTATLDQPENGLTEEILANTDVLIWWGHWDHEAVLDSVVQRVQRHVLGGMGLVALHSAHHSKVMKSLLGTTLNLKWRHGDRERVWCVNPSHPIAQGVPAQFELAKEEMYGEPFDIPEPLETLFLGWFSGGEVFRSGITFKRGNGKIFYFQPGHEEYPIYHNENVQKIITNAVKWARPAAKAPHTTIDVEMAEPLEK